MAVNEINVKYVAHLARLGLSPVEEQTMAAHLGGILGYIEKLQELNVTNVEPTAHAIPVFNVFRPDNPRDWFDATTALSNAPRQANGLFSVTKVVE